MMKGISEILFLALGAFVAFSCVNADDTKLKCSLPPTTIPKDWITIVDPCTEKMKEQVSQELSAALIYMSMGAHFAKDTINRPGFSEMFFASASEERQHALKLIEYLLMRGVLTENVRQLIQGVEIPTQTSWKSAFSAMEDALKLEAHVTKKIRDVMIVCENPGKGNNGEVFNDYHLVDYLTGVYLEEQLRGERDLAGKLSTLGKMMNSHGAIGEFLFDKTLLNGA